MFLIKDEHVQTFLQKWGILAIINRWQFKRERNVVVNHVYLYLKTVRVLLTCILAEPAMSGTKLKIHWGLPDFITTQLEVFRCPDGALFDRRSYCEIQKFQISVNTIYVFSIISL